MSKRIISMMLTVLCALSIMALPMKVTKAESASKVTEETVIKRIYLLNSLIGGKYFTVSGKPCGGDCQSKKVYACGNCNMGNVIASKWFKQTVGHVPASTSSGFRHYYNNRALVRGWTCCGFANYAGWFIFSQKASDVVIFEPLKNYNNAPFNSQTMKAAKPGDILRFGKSQTGKGTHSAIFISADNSGVTYLDCNGSSKDPYKVAIKTIKYASSYYSANYKYVGISRATNYDLLHTHTAGNMWLHDEAQHWHACTGENCNEKLDVAAHTWNDGVITIRPTGTQTGIKTFTCTFCDRTKTESIPVTILYGDVNLDGKVNGADIILLSRYLARWNLSFSSNQLHAMDVNADGSINGADIILFARYLAKWNVTLGPQ